MRPVVALLVIAVLGAAAPAIALGGPRDGHGRGGWRAEGGGRGGDPYGGRGRAEGPRRPEGPSYGGRYPGPYGGAYAEPPRSRYGNSLGEYYGDQQDEAREGVRQGFRSMRTVMDDLRRRTPGRLLDAGLEQGPDGRPVYRVRWGAANGRRIDYIIDARTGAILEAEGQ